MDLSRHTNKRTLDDTCALWMPFYLHGLENTKMLDYSQHHNDGTRYGAIPTENGWYFDGVDDKIIVTDNSSLHVYAIFTITAFVKPTAISGDYRAIINKRSTHWYGMWISPDGYLLYGNDGGNIKGTIPLYINNWYFLTITYNGSQIKLYVNATFDVSGNSTVIENSGNVAIGHSNNLNWFNGSIGDVKIFNRALSQEEIQSMYNKERKIFGV